MHAKDYYEVLAINKKATETEIKQAFKIRCLEVHPDKNKAPGATEAFQGWLFIHLNSIIFITSILIFL